MSEKTISIDQALRRIAALANVLKDNTQRANAAVAFEVQNLPAFNFTECVELAEKARKDIVYLKDEIASAGARTMLTFEVDGKVEDRRLSYWIRTLQELRGEIAFYKALPVRNQRETEETEMRYASSGVDQPFVKKFNCVLPEKDRAAKVDELQRRFSALNDAVETVNRQTRIPVED